MRMNHAKLLDGIDAGIPQKAVLDGNGSLTSAIEESFGQSCTPFWALLPGWSGVKAALISSPGRSLSMPAYSLQTSWLGHPFLWAAVMFLMLLWTA